MICTKCGSDNPDEAAYCQACGRKLQSAREARPQDETAPSGGVVPPLPLLRPTRRGADKLRPYGEAWLVGLAAAGLFYLLLGRHLAWPLVLLVGLAAGFAWLRGLR